MVLGAAQDGGHPQAGCARACCTALPHGVRHLPACLGIVDPATHRRWLIDATPALPEQLRKLDGASPGGLDGIFLTHAHMGHYTGLMYLGREVMGTRDVPLHVQPRMATFLRENGPWKQLVDLGNVRLSVGSRWQLSPELSVQAIPVPHRDEFSETVAFVIRGPTRAVLWLPDIDRWDGWDAALEATLASVDAAWIDGTFWADGELKRDMAEVPHPRIRETVARLSVLAATERAKVRFVHLNHTNPAWDPASTQALSIVAAGIAVATEGERFDL